MHNAANIAETINKILGNDKWLGDSPYIIKIKEMGKSYTYELRRGANWITIRETANSPIEYFYLERNGDGWEYDVHWIMRKSKRSALLGKAYKRIKKAVKASKEKI